MPELFYTIGVITVGALIVYLIQRYEKNKPKREIPEEAKRYFSKLESLLSNYSSDKTVVEFLNTAATELKGYYSDYKTYPEDEHLTSIFGPESFGKNREEALALCLLISYRASPIINEMRPRLKERFLSLVQDPAVCPYALYEPFRDIRDLIREQEYKKQH